MKIRKIMVSQPKPELERSPYFELARNYGVEIDFRPFIQIEPIPSRDFRKNRIDILSYTAVILTSKNAVDHFFRMCNEMRIIVPETMKYFCISEATAYYLQKYIQYRKRKIFSSNFSFADLVEIIKKKHKEDKFILPCAIDSSEEYTVLLDKEGIRYVKAPMYKAIYSQIADINFSEYDLLVLFSSAGLTSLLTSFPRFHENNIMIAAFGEQTALAILEAGLKLHIHAPQPQATSMAMALEQYLKGELSNNPWQQVPFKAKGAGKKEEKKAVGKPRDNKNNNVSLPAKKIIPSTGKPPVANTPAPLPIKKQKKAAPITKPSKAKTPNRKPKPRKAAPAKIKATPHKTIARKMVKGGKKQPAKTIKKPVPAKKRSVAGKKRKLPAGKNLKANKNRMLRGKKAKVTQRRKR